MSAERVRVVETTWRPVPEDRREPLLRLLFEPDTPPPARVSSRQVPCPFCRAEAGAVCLLPSGRWHIDDHRDRHRAAEAENARRRRAWVLGR